MKATELRIGNYIKQPNGVNTVFRISEGEDVNTFPEEEIEPIPLSEEWLEKFGFKKETAWYRLGKHAIKPLLANLYEFKNIPIIEVAYKR